MLLSILSLVVCGVIAWIAYLRIKMNKMAELSEKLPGPKTIPFLGNALDVSGLNMNSEPKDFFYAVVKLAKDYGPLFRLWLGTDLVVILGDPDLVEGVLTSNVELDKASNYRYLWPWLGNGLLTSTGQMWKKHRRIITPTFHFKILEDFVDVYNYNGKKLIEKLKRKVNGPEVDIYPYISLCTLDIIAETAMGISINAQENENPDFVRATGEKKSSANIHGENIARNQIFIIGTTTVVYLQTITRVVLSRTFKPLLQWDFLFHLLPTGKIQRDAVKVLHGMSNQVIKDRKAEYLNKKKIAAADQDEKPVEHNDVGAKKRKAFLDILLEATQENMTLTDEELREEVDTFMFEGHDTTTSGISFALSCLSHHPEVQERAYQEQQAIFGDSDRDATYQDLQEMKYLEQVIKEAQRVFPTVPLYGRKLKNDLKLGEYVLPKGASIQISLYLLHRNEKYFPNPEKFDPERFSPENVRGRHPYLFIPFSAGPRNCIGQRFAMLEMKSTISKMLRNFKMMPGSTTNKLEELAPDAVLKNSRGIRMKLIARK